MNLSAFDSIDEKVEKLVSLVEKLKNERNEAFKENEQLSSKCTQQEKEIQKLVGDLEKLTNGAPVSELNILKEEEVISSIKSAIKKIEKLQMALL